MITANKRTEYQGKLQQDREIQIDTTEYTTRLDLLYDVAQKATSYSEVLKLIENILRITQRILQVSSVSLFLVNSRKGVLYYLPADGKEADGLSQKKLDVDSGIVGWVARDCLPVVANDISKDERFNKDIDEVPGVAARSIMAVPLGRGQKVIGVLEVINKADGSPFNEQDLSVLTGLASTEALILLVSMATTTLHNIELKQTEPNWQETTIETLVAVADIEGSYASGHSQRVRDYVLLAAKSLSFSPEELQIIEFGALLHDIGKIGIDDDILLSSGSLSEEERSIIHKHPVIGANILGEIPFLVQARDIVLNHHEWYDGTGYPEGLKGENIPIGARLVAVADAFDTITTEHFYRAALSVDEAISELTRCAGTQFCPKIVEAFISALKKQEEELARKDAERAAREKQEAAVGEERKVKDAESADAWRSQGINLLRAGKNEEALEAFEKTVELNPESAIAWSNKGTALGRLGRDEEALAALVKSIELDPGSISAWFNKATALRKLGRIEEAQEARKVEKSLKKKAEQEAREQAKRKAEEARETKRLEKEKAEQEAREKAKRKVEEAAKKLEKRRAEQEAREKAKRKAEEAREAKRMEKEKAEQEAREQAMRKAEEAGEARRLEKEKAEQEAREKAKRKAEEAREAKKLEKEKAEQEAREKAKRKAEEAREAKRLGKKKAKPEAREIEQNKDTESADVWRDKGIALVREGQDSEALEAFLKAINLDPKYTIQRRNKIVDLLRFWKNKKAREAKKLEKKKAEQEAREKAKREAEEARETEADIYPVGSELFEGDVRLEIKSSAGYERVEQFKRRLSMIENLKVTLDSWSEDEGILIVVSLQATMPLGNILSQMWIVEQVYKNQQNVVVVLKA